MYAVVNRAHMSTQREAKDVKMIPCPQGGPKYWKKGAVTDEIKFTVSYTGVQ